MDADKAAGVELLNRYLLALDGREPAPWVALFTEGGVFANPPQPAACGPRPAATTGCSPSSRGWHAWASPRRSTTSLGFR